MEEEEKNPLVSQKSRLVFSDTYDIIIPGTSAQYALDEG